MTLLPNENELDSPPADLPVDAAEFWRGEAEYERPVLAEIESSLKRLGPFPVARGAFPLMGFFATVYEHVAAQARDPRKNSE